MLTLSGTDVGSLARDVAAARRHVRPRRRPHDRRRGAGPGPAAQAAGRCAAGSAGARAPTTASSSRYGPCWVSRCPSQLPRRSPARLVAKLGTPLKEPVGSVTHLFPSADLMAADDLSGIGLTKATPGDAAAARRGRRRPDGPAPPRRRPAPHRASAHRPSRASARGPPPTSPCAPCATQMPCPARILRCSRPSADSPERPPPPRTWSGTPSAGDRGADTPQCTSGPASQTPYARRSHDQRQHHRHARRTVERPCRRRDRRGGGLHRRRRPAVHPAARHGCRARGTRPFPTSAPPPRRCFAGSTETSLRSTTSRSAQSGSPYQQAIWAQLSPGAQRRDRNVRRAGHRGQASRRRRGRPGSACGANLIAPFVPCHRAVRSGGALGGYEYGLEVKRWLLRHESSGRQGLSEDAAG